MRKTLLTSILLSVLGLGAWAATYVPSDRLDFTKADGTSVSFMTGDIRKMTYLPGAGGETFTDVQILLQGNETRTLSIAEYPEVKYCGITDEWLEIARVSDGHSRVIMLDCINNEHIMSPDKPLDWTADRAGGMPHFLYEADPGYDAAVAIVGQYTGTVYTDRAGFLFWSEKDDNLLGRDCWSFVMPNEPVDIRTVATERDTYEGKPFVGKYKGFYLHPTPEQTMTATDPTLTLELMASGAYTVTSTDEQEFDVYETYIFNEAKQTFAYEEVPREDSDKGDYTIYYGVRGQLVDGFCFIDMINKIEDKPENVFRYCLSKSDFDLNYAVRDEWGSKYLLEAVMADGTPKYFFLDNYGALVKPATVDFIFGENIMFEGCKAQIVYDGVAQWQYELIDGKPQFVEKGAEAGTYQPTEGATDVLMLDGFGYASFDGGKTFNRYFIDGMIATITINGEPQLFVIDPAAGTYRKMVSDPWDGPAVYENIAVPGMYQGVAGTKNVARFTFDKDLLDRDKPGTAAFVVTMPNDFGSTSDIVATMQKYIYDSRTQTVTITRVLMGDANGANDYRNITFKLSDDRTKLYLEGEGEAVRIYQAGVPANYVELGVDNAMTAQVTQPITLAAAYKGTVTLDMMGSPMEGQSVSLLIDQDPSGAAKAGYATLQVTALGTDFLNACVQYAVDGATLTLKGVTVGDGNYGEMTVDLTFASNGDGTLTGSGKHFGVTTETAYMAADFSTCTLSPVTE